jgi:hypothetical protein
VRIDIFANDSVKESICKYKSDEWNYRDKEEPVFSLPEQARKNFNFFQEMCSVKRAFLACIVHG